MSTVIQEVFFWLTGKVSWLGIYYIVAKKRTRYKGFA